MNTNIRMNINININTNININININRQKYFKLKTAKKFKNENDILPEIGRLKDN